MCFQFGYVFCTERGHCDLTGGRVFLFFEEEELMDFVCFCQEHSRNKVDVTSSEEDG